MHYRRLGQTDLKVSVIGFGAWGIGGPAMVGNIPIGWGAVDDNISRKAIDIAVKKGINFFDTADFYGLGHSEKLLGQYFSKNWDGIILATKVGHRVSDDDKIILDYSKKYIKKACELSLKRLQKDVIDLYQLHSAKLAHLQAGECIEAMEELKNEGKIRYWGISLNTFNPQPEADFLVKYNLGHVFQLVLNVINQRALSEVIPHAQKNKYGIIARMPLQFGVLTKTIHRNKVFPIDDHRHFRLNPILNELHDKLDFFWDLADKYNISPTTLALSFILMQKGVTTTIPGIKTPEQADLNSNYLLNIQKEDLQTIFDAYSSELKYLVDKLEALG